MKKLFLLLMLVSVSISSWAGANSAEAKARNDRDAFIAKIEASISICGFKGKLKAMEMPRLDTAAASASMGELAECISKEKTQAADIYPAVAKSLAGNLDALKAFKRYYAFWITCMDAFLANVTEGDRVYGRVMDSNRQRLDELYNEYKIELE